MTTIFFTILLLKIFGFLNWSWWAVFLTHICIYFLFLVIVTIAEENGYK